MTRHLRLAGDCPNTANHTALPDNYVARVERMTVLSRTHEQVQCPGCRRWIVYVPRTDVRAEGAS